MPRRQKPKLGLGARGEESEQRISSTKLSPGAADKKTPLCPVAEKSKPRDKRATQTEYTRGLRTGKRKLETGKHEPNKNPLTQQQKITSTWQNEGETHKNKKFAP
jgi:hypothetical protein